MQCRPQFGRKYQSERLNRRFRFILAGAKTTYVRSRWVQTQAQAMESHSTEVHQMGGLLLDLLFETLTIIMLYAGSCCISGKVWGRKVFAFWKKRKFYSCHPSEPSYVSPGKSQTAVAKTRKRTSCSDILYVCVLRHVSDVVC